MLAHLKFENILFLDIETVPRYKSQDEMPEVFSKLWEKKVAFIRKETETDADVYKRAGIYAEFGKIICISTGILGYRERKACFRVLSFAGDDEKLILSGFLALIEKITQTRDLLLCAHNGKEFDFPYIARRSLIHGLKLPDILDTAGKKPWDVRHLDTMELWKFGDYKHYTSLELLAALFNIPSPKTDIDGSMVAEVYWNQGDLPRIVEYCQRDVVTIAQLMRRYKGESLIDPESVEIVLR
jgi:hypothetical protein